MPSRVSSNRATGGRSASATSTVNIAIEWAPRHRHCRSTQDPHRSRGRLLDALSRASAPRSVIRSASSITTTPSQGRADGRVGLMAERRTSSRTSSTPIESSSVRTSVTSGCEPDSDVRHAVHFPQPPEPHCSAAAKARAPHLIGPNWAGRCTTRRGSWRAARLPPRAAA
jgi:hypothetical protein